MNEKDKIREKINELVQQYFTLESKERGKTLIPGDSKIPLNVPSYGWKEVNEALDSMLTAQITMGQKVKQFESAFAEYIGAWICSSFFKIGIASFNNCEKKNTSGIKSTVAARDISMSSKFTLL